MLVVIGLVFAIAGKVLTGMIHSDVKYLFTDMTPFGLGVAGLFTLSAGFNFLGSRFTVRKAFVESAPISLILVAAFTAFVALIAALTLGAESRYTLPIVGTGACIILGAWFAAFFVRGLAAEDSEGPEGYLRGKLAPVISIKTRRRRSDAPGEENQNLKLCV